MEFIKKIKSFTLVEILIAIIILSIGLITMVGIMASGRFFLQKAENQANALRVVSTRLTEFTASSYDGLMSLINNPTSHPLATMQGRSFGNCNNSLPNAINCRAIWGQENNVNWRVEVNSLNLTNTTASITIPYIEVVATGSYQEESIRGKIATKEIRMRDLVSYPHIHLLTRKIEENQNNPLCPSRPRNSSGLPLYSNLDDPRNFGLPAIISNFDTGLSLTINYPTKKNLLIIYNISLDVQDRNGGVPPNFSSVDTVLTACIARQIMANGTLGNLKLESIHTRTPIISQPLITNVITIQNVPPNTDYPISIRWFRDVEADSTGGGNLSVQLKEAEIIVVAIEAN